MGSEWKTVCIDQIKSPQKYSCVGGPFGSSLSRKHYVDSGVPVIRGVNLSGDIFSESEFVFVSPEKSQELQRNMAFRGDLVFTQRGTLGQVALIPENSDYECYVVSQSQMKLTVDPTKADPYFIYSYFRSKEAKTVIEKSAIVGGVPHINLGILKDFKLRLPSLSVQQAVSKIAKDFDRKMLLNNQINQTLEQMAQTLFKSWFVDYDPVIDNALDVGNPIPEVFETRVERRKAVRESADFKPLPDDVRQLFPSEFEESELGWVPKGWDTKSIKDFGKVVTGKTPPKKIEDAYGDKGVPFITPTDIDKDVYVIGTKRFLTEAGVEVVKKNLLPKSSICVTCIGSQMGKAVIAPTMSISNQQINSVITKKEHERIFLFLNLRSRREEIFLVGSSGSTMPIINKSTFEKLPVLVPGDAILKFFDSEVAPLLNRIHSSSLESKTLSTIRDTLLPKLISGELRLDSPEVEQAKALVD
ncbi:restriction endonuclease [Vibrio rotiferianus]|uniref:restriction endonuclease subunit S n=1 Tax=Vibrio rotiferianus TaxID=190895 RepID=UPI001110B649|nr:restriction endonuclease subunit S [Vibrio rotiferianus]TMX42118.1 restriction endonuclease [Vibrio rotiferianus]TMX58341.1 restriction endonuclease [Vibrio rotiferianus]TMX68386.1 restriction endonuclease [Vibrio rotiferianus]